MRNLSSLRCSPLFLPNSSRTLSTVHFAKNQNTFFIKTMGTDWFYLQKTTRTNLFFQLKSGGTIANETGFIYILVFRSSVVLNSKAFSMVFRTFKVKILKQTGFIWLLMLFYLFSAPRTCCFFQNETVFICKTNHFHLQFIIFVLTIFLKNTSKIR